MIEANILSEAARTGVKRLIFLGSSCIYPRECPQPVREEYLLTGLLEQTNRPYAIAKIAGIEMCSAFNRQYHTRFLAVMPTNLYGVGDHYDLQNSHVIPALILKMQQAKERGDDTVMLWGTGKARREFLFSDDLAKAMLMLMDLPEGRFNQLINTDSRNYPLINAGCGHDITIADLATLVADTVGFKGKICWDHSKPDGTPRKVLDVSRIHSLGWRPEVSLEQGLHRVYQEKFGALVT
jgi:GDP-L-fucose synthase